MDVGFFEAEDPVAASLARAGLRFDLPQPEAAAGMEAGHTRQRPGQAARLK